MQPGKAAGQGFRCLFRSKQSQNTTSGMKSILSFFALFAGIFAASAQVDTIYTHEGVIPCNITEITETARQVPVPR